MKTSDIPDIPVLWYILCVNTTGKNVSILYPRDRLMIQAFPLNTPEKLVLSKFKSLKKKGFIDGCVCGCRGDFTISDKGKDFLKKSFPPTNQLAGI